MPSGPFVLKTGASENIVYPSPGVVPSVSAHGHHLHGLLLLFVHGGFDAANDGYEGQHENQLGLDPESTFSAGAVSKSAFVHGLVGLDQGRRLESISALMSAFILNLARVHTKN